MAPTLFAPAPVRSLTTLPPIDLGTMGPGRYPTMAELRNFPAPSSQQSKQLQAQMQGQGGLGVRVYAVPAEERPREVQQLHQQQLPAQQQPQAATQAGGSSWYSRERRVSAGAAQQGPPTVQGKRERRDSAGPVGPPTRRPVRPVMPPPLSAQQQQQQQQQQPVFVPMNAGVPRPQQQQVQTRSALPPTTQPRVARPSSAGAQPQAQPFPSMSSRPARPPSAPPAQPPQPTQPTQPVAVVADPEPHPWRGPFLSAFHGHRVLRKKHAPSPSVDQIHPSSSSSPPTTQPNQPRRRAWSFGRKPAPAPLQVPLQPPPRRQGGGAEEDTGSPVELRFAQGSVHRFGREEERVGRLRVVNAEPEESPDTPRGPGVQGGWGGQYWAERDGQGDVRMRDAGHAAVGGNTAPTGAPGPAHVAASGAQQARATVVLPSAQQQQQQQQRQRGITLQTQPRAGQGQGMLVDIVRPEPQYAPGAAPTRARAVQPPQPQPQPAAQPVQAMPPPAPQSVPVRASQPVVVPLPHQHQQAVASAPPAPASNASLGSQYRGPEPAYPQRPVVYDVPNPYRPPSAQAHPAQQVGGVGYTQSAPASVARSTYSLPSTTSGRSVRGAETDTEVHSRSRVAAVAPASAGHAAAGGAGAGGAQTRSRLYSESERDYALVYGQPQQGGQMGNVRATATAGGEHRPHLTYEIIAAAAGFAAMRIWEDHLRQQGQQPRHSLAKEILAAIAAAEVDRLVETKGLDWLDKQRAKRDAGSRADKLVQERYPDTGSSPSYAQGQQGQAPREHSPPAQPSGQLRAPPPPTTAASTSASGNSRRSSMSASGRQPPITLFVPPENSPWKQMGRPGSTQYQQYPQQGQRASGGQQQQPGYAHPQGQAHHGHGGHEDDMSRLREEEAKRGKLIKRDFVEGH